MKKVEQLEKELIDLGRELSAISVEIGRSEITYYRDNKKFLAKLDEYKACFEVLYRTAERESYLWSYCSYKLFRSFIDKDLKSREEYSLEMLYGFLKGVFLELVIPFRYPILTDKNLNVSDTDYPFYLKKIDTYFLSDWQLQRDLRDDMHKKQDFILSLRTEIESQLSELREKEQLHLKSEAVGVLNNFLLQNDKIGNKTVVDDVGNSKIIKPLKLSLVEQAMMFYYLESVGLLPIAQTKKRKMELFIEKQGLTIKVETFQSKYCNAGKRLIFDDQTRKNLLNIKNQLVHVSDALKNKRKAQIKCKGDIAEIQRYIGKL